MDSILESIKKMLGPSGTTAFDTDIIININAVFMILNDLGVGPKETFSITSSRDTWDDFLSNTKALEAVKSYMFLKVKMAFDPPTNSVIAEAYKEQIKEYECRLRDRVERGDI